MQALSFVPPALPGNPALGAAEPKVGLPTKWASPFEMLMALGLETSGEGANAAPSDPIVPTDLPVPGKDAQTDTDSSSAAANQAATNTPAAITMGMAAGGTVPSWLPSTPTATAPATDAPVYTADPAGGRPMGQPAATHATPAVPVERVWNVNELFQPLQAAIRHVAADAAPVSVEAPVVQPVTSASRTAPLAEQPGPMNEPVPPASTHRRPTPATPPLSSPQTDQPADAAKSASATKATPLEFTHGPAAPAQTDARPQTGKAPSPATKTTPAEFTLGPAAPAQTDTKSQFDMQDQAKSTRAANPPAEIEAPRQREQAESPRTAQTQIADPKRDALASAPVASGAASTDTTHAASLMRQVHRVTEMLINRLEGSVRVTDNRVEASLRLDPPDLGVLRVELQVRSDSSMQARFIAERPETAQLIQQHIGQLQDGLARQGMAVDRIQLSVQATASGGQSSTDHPLSDPSGQEARRQQFLAQQQQQRRQDSGTSGRPRWSFNEDAA